MSVDVGKIIPFLGNTSCMNVEERKYLALIETIKGMFKDDKEFIKFLEQEVKPFFENMGRARWNRDIVSDLGFALSLRKSRRKDVSKILKWKPPQK